MSFIAGLLFTVIQPQAQEIRGLLGQMLQAGFRGADDRNMALLPPLGLAVAARRTLDLTPDGLQPFTDRAGRISVALDGHIGNAASLRHELEDAGIRLRGHGDGEIIAEGASKWGLNRLLQKLEGAFTFALWDAHENALHLVRDRLGARPLYVTRLENAFAFASTPDAFKSLPAFESAIDTDGAAAYLAFGHVPAPRTLWQNVASLPAAHRLMLKPADSALPTPESYWSPASAIEESMLRGRGDSAKLDRLSAQLATESMRLDVPFAMLDDFSPAAAQLRAVLDRASEKPFKSWPLTQPDGASLQTAFDTLAALPQPVSEPLAPALLGAFKNAGKDAGVVMLACAITLPADEDVNTRKWRRLVSLVPSFLRGLLPENYAAYARNIENEYFSAPLWNTGAQTPTIIEPRIDAAPQARLDYYEFCDRFCHGHMPALDRIANAAGVELRLPLADARMLDMGLPRWASASMPDIATWLRGPLRPRVQDLLQATLLSRIGIDDPKPYIQVWNAFLNGDNTHTRALWTLATLLAWTSRH